jgi:hypothetical protein
MTKKIDIERFMASYPPQARIPSWRRETFWRRPYRDLRKPWTNQPGSLDTVMDPGTKV